MLIAKLPTQDPVNDQSRIYSLTTRAYAFTLGYHAMYQEEDEECLAKVNYEAHQIVYIHKLGTTEMIIIEHRITSNE